MKGIMVDKVLASTLREQGMGYAEIAQQTGCSIDWCKRNLKGVSKNKSEKEAIKQCVSLAQSKDGITNGEIKSLVRSVYPFEDSKEYEIMEKKAITRFKSVINKSENTVVRPYWMQPRNANLSFRLVLSSVDIISQRMNDEVDNIRKILNLDIRYDSSVRYAIIKMLMGSGLAHEGVANHCEHLESVSCKLEERNP
jgi:hypothetical protein